MYDERTASIRAGHTSIGTGGNMSLGWERGERGRREEGRESGREKQRKQGREWEREGEKMRNEKRKASHSIAQAL